jgi:hypothetical protein
MQIRQTKAVVCVEISNDELETGPIKGKLKDGATLTVWRYPRIGRACATVFPEPDGLTITLPSPYQLDAASCTLKVDKFPYKHPERMGWPDYPISHVILKIGA